MFVGHTTKRLQIIPSHPLPKEPLIFCGFNTSKGPQWVQLKVSDQWSTVCQTFRRFKLCILHIQYIQFATSKLCIWPVTDHVVIHGELDWEVFRIKARMFAHQSDCSTYYPVFGYLLFEISSLSLLSALGVNQ